MEEAKVVRVVQPGEFEDALTAVLRAGARDLLAQAIEAEVEDFRSRFADQRLKDGRERLVRHGFGPERIIQTGIGPVPVRRAKLRDRSEADAGESCTDESRTGRIRFCSALLPKWSRRSKSLDALIPTLYLGGISSGDFQMALAALLGKDAPNVSPAVAARLKATWEDDFARWQKRDLSARRYVYLWADGVYLQARMEDLAECMLVVIGATPEGKKELVGFQTGFRESAQSWREMFCDMKARGLAHAPAIAVGDGALGFWKALEEVFPSTQAQRCLVHKTANVLNKMPKSLQSKAKKDLHEIWSAPDRAAANRAIDVFFQKYNAKYDKAVQCLVKDRVALLAFYDFPAEHWHHLRTGNPLENVFATVRHRTTRTKGALSPDTARLMVFKLVREAEKNWLRLRGQNLLPRVIDGVTFKDGVEAIKDATNAA
jgi:putative transposase